MPVNGYFQEMNFGVKGLKATKRGSGLLLEVYMLEVLRQRSAAIYLKARKQPEIVLPYMFDDPLSEVLPLLFS